MILWETCGRAIFRMDFNQDGLITISDFGNQFKEVLLLPSTLVLAGLHQFESLWIFLELNCQSGSGIFGGLFSAFVWLMVFTSIASGNEPPK